MGYQEAFRPIEHLAEAAGIKKAVEDYDDNPYIPEYCRYCCASREKATGKLYVCITGQRCRVHIIAGYDLDYRIPYGANYADYYEDLDEALVEEAAKERPDLVARAYEACSEAFERAAEEGRKWEEDLRAEANALWPDIAKLLISFGPMTARMLGTLPLFKDHFLDNVLVDLSRQGLVTCDGQFFRDDLRLTDKAMKQQGIKELPAASDVEERLVLLLELSGPLSTWDLAMALDLSRGKVLELLHKYIDSGSVVPEGHGRSRRYRLAKATPDAA